MSNRDFDARPNQAGGRTNQDYGNTSLGSEPKSSNGIVGAILFGIVVAAAGYAAFLMQLGEMPA